MPDHLHLFVEADPTRCVAEMVHRWKGFTSDVLPTEFVSWRSRWPTLLHGRLGEPSLVRTYIETPKKVDALGL